MSKVNLWRKIVVSDIFFRPQKLRVFLLLLLRATPSKREIRLKDGEIITLQPGEGFIGKAKLAKDLSFFDGHNQLKTPSIQSVNYYLEELKKDLMITATPSLLGFLYSIVNYSKYNSNGEGTSLGLTQKDYILGTVQKTFPFLSKAEADQYAEAKIKIIGLEKERMQYEKESHEFDIIMDKIAEQEDVMRKLVDDVFSKEDEDGEPDSTKPASLPGSPD